MLRVMIALILLACTGQNDPVLSPVPDRQPGERAPLTAACNELDPLRCLLPWPSSTNLELDPTTASGVRVRIDPASLEVDDDPSYLEQGDGFSRLSPLATGFSGRISADWLATTAPPAWADRQDRGILGPNGALRLYDVTPGSPTEGEAVPLWAEIIRGGSSIQPLDLLLAYPRVLLAANTDYLVVLTDEVKAEDGSDLPVERPVQVALGLVEPETQEEAALAAYHAPTRASLATAGIDPAHVLRVWDFTTRSAEDAARRLLAMMEVISETSTDLTVEIDVAASSAYSSIDRIVRGRLKGVPDFLGEEGRFSFDQDGRPEVKGTRDAEFRIVLPHTGTDGLEGTDYRIALYGHGTGGDVSDDAFDPEIAGEGIAKVGIRFLGWNGEDLIYTLSNLTHLMQGTETSTASLLQSVSDGYAVFSALEGPLGEVLSAETIDGEENPAAGRHPDLTDPVWVGGSLGGTMGAIIGAAYPEIGAAVLNVPAGAWTHLVADSMMYDAALKGFLENTYGNQLDARLAIIQSQGGWDDVDGAAWADEALADGDLFLLQESIGDSVVPNQGTEVLAAALHAVMVGPPIESVPMLEEVEVAHDQTGLTQFKVPSTGVFDVHGFAALDTPAGEAAMGQILAFIQSYWAGSVEIEFPEGCTQATPDGTCDFSEAWGD